MSFFNPFHRLLVSMLMVSGEGSILGILSGTVPSSFGWWGFVGWGVFGVGMMLLLRTFIKLAVWVPGAGGTALYANQAFDSTFFGVLFWFVNTTYSIINLLGILLFVNVGWVSAPLLAGVVHLFFYKKVAFQTPMIVLLGVSLSVLMVLALQRCFCMDWAVFSQQTQSSSLSSSLWILPMSVMLGFGGFENGVAGLLNPNVPSDPRHTQEALFFGTILVALTRFFITFSGWASAEPWGVAVASSLGVFGTVLFYGSLIGLGISSVLLLLYGIENATLNVVHNKIFPKPFQNFVDRFPWAILGIVSVCAGLILFFEPATSIFWRYTMPWGPFYKLMSYGMALASFFVIGKRQNFSKKEWRVEKLFGIGALIFYMFLLVNVLSQDCLYESAFGAIAFAGFVFYGLLLLILRRFQKS